MQQAAFTVISTIVGGGIVSLPNGFYYNGIVIGLALVILMALQTTYSARLYMLARELLPGSPESMYEIGYILFKRNSIFFISAILIFNSFGLMLIYFIVFGDTMASLVLNLSGLSDENFFCNRAAYVIIITILLTPVAVKKQLEDLKIISQLLFASIFCFILITCIQLGV